MKKQEKLALVESALEDFYGDQQFAFSLRESVLYSIHAGGKRIRQELIFLASSFKITFCSVFLHDLDQGLFSLVQRRLELF